MGARRLADTAWQAERALLGADTVDNASLLQAVGEILGPSASIDEIRVQATAMWSVAHGLATLLIDGPLENKIGKVSDRRVLVRAVARRMIDGITSH